MLSSNQGHICQSTQWVTNDLPKGPSCSNKPFWLWEDLFYFRAKREKKVSHFLAISLWRFSTWSSWSFFFLTQQKRILKTARSPSPFLLCFLIQSISTLGQKFSICPKIDILKISYFTKFTFSKSHFLQNSQFQNLIFQKIHIFQTPNISR